MEAGYQQPQSLVLMRAFARMKSSATLQMKLNPPTRRQAGFHPRRGFHRRRRFVPPDRVDLAEMTVVSIKTTVISWRRVRDSNPRFLSESLVFKTSSLNHSDNSPFIPCNIPPKAAKVKGFWFAHQSLEDGK